MPDFNAPEFAMILQPQVQDGTTMEDLVRRLQEAWTTGHQQKVTDWNAWQAAEAERLRIEEERRQEEQREEERRKAAEEAQKRKEEEARQAAAEEERRKKEEEEARERERQQRDADKQSEKRPKLNSIQTGVKVDDNRITQPSAYALTKLRNFDYIELYYFTTQGCDEAASKDTSTAKESLAATQIDDVIVFQSVGAHKPSNKVQKDTELSWRDISIAKTLLIKLLRVNKWPEEHVLALEEFFYELEKHDMHRRPKGTEAVIRYQAEVRRSWWNLLKAPDATLFDIAAINETRMERIYNEILADAQLAGIKL